MLEKDDTGRTLTNQMRKVLEIQRGQGSQLVGQGTEHFFFLEGEIASTNEEETSGCRSAIFFLNTKSRTISASVAVYCGLSDQHGKSYLYK